jgi:hypothetical protein
MTGQLECIFHLIQSNILMSILHKYFLGRYYNFGHRRQWKVLAGKYLI